jgi:cytosine deaminase
MLLSGGIDAAGRRLDLRCDRTTGLITEAAPGLTLAAGEQLVDCTGLVLLAAPVEPHCHLDKALSGDRAPNPKGDLPGAIEAWVAYREHLDEDDIEARGMAAALELVAHGTTTIRSHVDVGAGIGLRGVDALSRVKQQLAADGLADLQLVALVKGPEISEMLQFARDAIEHGADIVGGVPHVEPDPVAATWALAELAAELGRPLDLHVDETLNPGATWVEDLAEAVLGFPSLQGHTVAGHCVSLGVQDPARQGELARKIAASGVAVVSLPGSNLYLQSRDHPSSPPRGITALRALLDAGAVVAAGGDNVRDPFNAVGRSDALETAALLVMAGHLAPAEAWHAVSAAGRTAMGLPPVSLLPGDPAEILAIRGSSLTDAVARASDERIVVHRGNVVASTTLQTTFHRSPTMASLT